MVMKKAVIKNRAGIHVRPSGLIMGAITGYTGIITLKNKEHKVQLSNIMALLSLGLVEGDEVEIIVEGIEEEKILQRLVDLLETTFDFPQNNR